MPVADAVAVEDIENETVLLDDIEKDGDADTDGELEVL